MTDFTIKGLDDLDPGFCNWLAGLVDGEGSLQLQRAHGQWLMDMTVSLRDDEKPMLQMIRQELGRGSCYPHRSRNPQLKSKPRYMVKFHNASDVRFIIALFERYPLRSEKKYVFELWAKARLELDKPSRARDQKYLRYLSRAIRDTRKYEPPSVEIYKAEGKQMALAIK